MKSATPKTKTEHAIQNEIWNGLASKNTKTFRANVGKGWTGSECIKLANGDMLIKNPRPFDTGLPVGFPDLFGMVQHTITEADIGKTYALFFGVEVKSATGKLSDAQAIFQKVALEFGARHGVARSVEDAKQIVHGAGYEQG